MKTKKQYINVLESDIQFFEGQLRIVRDGKRVKLKLFIWYLGERLPRYQAKHILVELKEELNKITIDKTYKPWK